MQVSQLFIYPVKSLRGIAVEKAELTSLGLKYDRHWMIIDDKNKFVTMRKHPKMTLIKTQLTPSHLVLSVDGMPDFKQPLTSSCSNEETSNPLKATIWSDECIVFDEGGSASEWLTQALQSKQTLRLVKMARNNQRPQSKPERFGNSTTQFADACAYLLCNQASLDALNSFLLDQQHSNIPIERFRPNVVVSDNVADSVSGDSNDGAFPAFAEHVQADKILYHNDYQLKLCDPCQRCVVPNIDIEKGVKDAQQQPYKSLVRLNPMPDNAKAAAFGQNMLLVNGAGAAINVGDVLALK